MRYTHTPRQRHSRSSKTPRKNRSNGVGDRRRYTVLVGVGERKKKRGPTAALGDVSSTAIVKEKGCCREGLVSFVLDGDRQWRWDDKDGRIKME